MRALVGIAALHYGPRIGITALRVWIRPGERHGTKYTYTAPGYRLKYKDMKVMKTILSYLRPAVVSMIAISGISILISSFFKDSLIGISYIRYHAIIVFILCLILLRKYKMNPILVMVLAGISEVVIQMI